MAQAQTVRCCALLVTSLLVVHPRTYAQAPGHDGPGRGGADALEAEGSFRGLQAQVRLGDPVAVVDESGRRVTGLIAGLSSAALTLRSRNGLFTFNVDEVRTVSGGRPDSLRDGALIGACVGAAVSLAVSPVGRSLVRATVASQDALGLYVVGTYVVPGAVLGAGIGAFIDAAYGKPKVLYDARRRPRVSVVPILDHGWSGAVVSVGF